MGMYVHVLHTYPQCVGHSMWDSFRLTQALNMTSVQSKLQQLTKLLYIYMYMLLQHLQLH